MNWVELKEAPVLRSATARRFSDRDSGPSVMVDGTLTQAIFAVPSGGLVVFFSHAPKQLAM